MPRKCQKLTCITCGKEVNTTAEPESYECFECSRKKDPNYIYEKEERLLRDGIYDLTDVQVLHFDANDVGEWCQAEKHKENEFITKFKEDHPDYVVGQAYETYSIYFLSKQPPAIGKDVMHFGEGFNYGAGVMLINLPSSILILAEND